MRKKLDPEKLIKLPTFSLHPYFTKHDKLWFFSDIDGPSKAYEINLEDFSYKPFKEHLDLGILSAFIWLEEGKKLLINRDTQGDEQYNICLYDCETEIETKLTDTPKNKEVFLDISSDKKFLLLKSNRNNTDNLYTLNLETNELTQITFHDAPIYGGAFWSSKNTIYYSARATDNKKNVDVWIVSEDGIDNRQLLSLSDDSIDSVVDISKDGELVLISSDAKGIEQPLVFNTKTQEIIWLGNDKFNERAIQISKDKKYVLILRDEAERIYPVIYAFDSKDIIIPKIAGTIYKAQFTSDNKYLFYYRSDPQTPTILALYELSSHKETPIIEPPIEYTKNDFYKPEFIKYKTFDGREIGAVLYKPDIEKGKKYPAIVLAPGGPGGRLLFTFFPFAQMVVDAGFVFISPHVRGSFGYGKEFRDLIFYDIGGGDAQDYLYVKKYLESLDFIDTDKIGITGGSYGGYMTYLQLTKYADAGWNAGVANVGITSWKTMYDAGMPAYKHFIETLFGTYEENRDLWEDRSPLNFVEKIKAPILIIHSVNDPRCPVGEARQFKEKLLQLNKKEGVDFSYIEIANEGHVLSGQEARLRDNRLTLEFFNRVFNSSRKRR
ncbi:MAG: prolyl oligopeptidase family serine peptidase [Candidatus Heimdallarchaeaceae archaeon]